MKDKAKLTDLLIKGLKHESAEQHQGKPQGTPPTEDDDSIDIDALEARIMEKIEAKMSKSTPTENEPKENPVTESTEE